MTLPVAIVGAGLAGLTAACRLRQAGLPAVVFEKSRGVGGRMSTRRTEHAAFDHGAQFFTARGPEFRAEVSAWRAAGVVDTWHGDHLVGVPGMTAPARLMAESCRVVVGSEINGLERTDAGWRLTSLDGPVKVYGQQEFARVVLAVPAPQAEKLAATGGVTLPGAADSTYAPCLALMLAYREPPTKLAESLKLDDEMIAWISRDGSKPGRASKLATMVVHATPDWSQANLDLAPEAIAAELFARFRALTGIDAEPAIMMAHRWRYALVMRPLGAPCIWLPDLALGACGDWCLGPRVECAFDSGVAVAEAIAADGQ